MDENVQHQRKRHRDEETEKERNKEKVLSRFGGFLLFTLVPTVLTHPAFKVAAVANSRKRRR